MSLIALIIDSVLLLAMICVSLYGAATLPPGAQLPVHFGPTGYNRWVSRNVGLVMWPAAGALVYTILAITARTQRTGGSGPAIGLSVALGVMLVTQIGALAVALSRKEN